MKWQTVERRKARGEKKKGRENKEGKRERVKGKGGGGDLWMNEQGK